MELKKGKTGFDFNGIIPLIIYLRESAPDANESISYGMPAYKLNGKPLVYFADYKSHIGFYTTPTAHAKVVIELSKYKQVKGSVQLPLD